MKTQEINLMLEKQSETIIESMNNVLENVNVARKNSASFEIMDYDFDNKYFILENNNDITVENDIVNANVIEKNTELHIYTYCITYFNESFDNTRDFIIIDNIIYPAKMAFYNIFKKELKNAALITGLDYRFLCDVFNKYSKEVVLFCLNLRRNKKYSSFLKLLLILTDYETNLSKIDYNDLMFEIEFEEFLELI